MLAPALVPADGDAVGIAHANELRHGRAAEQSREPQLVAARKEDPCGRLEPLQSAGLLAIPARVEIHHRHVRRA